MLFTILKIIAIVVRVNFLHVYVFVSFVHGLSTDSGIRSEISEFDQTNWETKHHPFQQSSISPTHFVATTKYFTKITTFW